MPNSSGASQSSEDWPPNYLRVYTDRAERLIRLRERPEYWAGALAFYKDRPKEFITDWVVTYDPRIATGDIPARLPFILFKRQREFVDFLWEAVQAQENGLAEKSRDVGATWICSAFSVWLWRFWGGASIGWGSRKEQLVDKIGDPDSIFEKMRIIIMSLPQELWPAGFRPDVHMTYMKIINPETGSTITGEAGDNIGRGGRKLVYFKDESAHYERPEKIEAALADNTRCQIDISSVHGLGNVFHRRREAGVEWTPGDGIAKGKTNVFIFDWRDHPQKTQAWYDDRRTRSESEGLLHLFAQEVDRDYSAAVEGVIIPAKWVSAAIDAHLKLGFDESGGWCAGLDVADGGGDRNALAVRKGVILKSIEEWGARDTGETTRRALKTCSDVMEHTLFSLQYDCIGVGAGVKAEANRLFEERLVPRNLFFAPWNAGAAVLNPESYVIPGDRNSPKNKDFYKNLKAQAWWQMRLRFERTYRAIHEKGFTWDAGDLISLPSTLPLLRSLQKELSQATASQNPRMQMVVDKAPEGTKSPNLADAAVMAYWPVGRMPMIVSDDAVRNAHRQGPR
jgi:hypothetical protein